MSQSRLPETSTIDRLYLELSQFTTATTRRELDFAGENQRLKDEIKRLREALESIRAKHCNKHTAPLINIAEQALAQSASEEHTQACRSRKYPGGPCDCRSASEGGANEQS